MNSLVIEKRDGYYVVKANDVVIERQNLEDVLKDTFFVTLFTEHKQVYLTEATQLISALFRVLNAVQVGVGGEGDWWFAEAEVQRDKPRFITDVETEHPISALRALIVEIVKEDDRLSM